jgi:hypothetical protein
MWLLRTRAAHECLFFFAARNRPNKTLAKESARTQQATTLLLHSTGCPFTTQHRLIWTAAHFVQIHPALFQLHTSSSPLTNWVLNLDEKNFSRIFYKDKKKKKKNCPLRTTITKPFFAYRKDWSRVGVATLEKIGRDWKKDWKKDWLKR